LRAAIQENPVHAMAHYDLGALLLKQGVRPKAIEHLTRTTQLRPDFADGHYNLAVALWMAGEYNNARREIDAAFRLNSTDPQIQELRTVMLDAAEP
jgi:tetratricopeptide (TPR) repeat protein